MTYGLHNQTESRLSHIKLRTVALGVVALTMGMQAAHAFGIDTGDSDTKIRWDNTIKYTAGWRTQNPDQYVADGNGLQPNTDFGDLANPRGLINNRFDLLSELDVTYKNLGFRISGAAWNDAHYTKDRNDYTGLVPNTQAAAAGGPNNLNSQASKDLMGRKAEILDAFVFGRFDFGGDTNATVRLGKHTLMYGETLFLGANGIANAQGPVDLVKAFSLPNAQFKEIAMPVGQISADIQINPTVSIGGYYQYEYKSMRFPSASSYFSPAEFLMPGGDLLLLPPFLGGPAVRAQDLKGSDSGNFGARLKFKVGDTDYGVYAARYDDKAPIGVVNVVNHTYQAMYAKKVDTYGASASTVFGETNVGAEVSIRNNVPLAVAGDLFFAAGQTDNEGNTAYARGKSFHLNLSMITLLPASPLWQGATFVGEFAFNRLLGVTNSGSALGLNPLNTTHTRDASAFRFVFTPEYFQVMPGIDLQIPIGLGYGLSGRSAIFQVAPEHGGDFSIGVNADINKTWKVGLNYTTYFGSNGPAPDLTGQGAAYKQYYGDRDFVTLSVQRTF